jgi:diguanylate cyclase (GGDEF)-like protein/PAS domain S-box-containing protein
MIRVRTLRSTIITQLALILAPIVAVLGFQSWEALRRAEVLAQLHRANALAGEARDRFAIFDGLASSATPGAVPGVAMLGMLKAARDKVRELEHFTGAMALANTVRGMNELITALEEMSEPDVLRAAQGRIRIVRLAVHQTAIEHSERLEVAVKVTAERARYVAWLAIGVTLIALGVAVLFIVRLVLGLTRPLSRAVSIANGIAEGREVAEHEFSSRGDIGDLLRSLGRMHASLRAYKADVAKYQHGLEEKYQQLEHSRRSLNEAQRLAQMGNWYWDLRTRAVHWSDELYRILGHEPGGCEPRWKNVIALVDVREQESLREDLRALMREPGNRASDNQITMPDGLYRVVHCQTTSVAGVDGRVERLYGTIHDITQRKRAEEKMHFLAMYDTLTGLPNRQMFQELLDRAVARARRASEHMAVMFMDLDRFKHINDTLGHAVGDLLLREVSARLNTCVRNTDQMARDSLPENGEAGQVARLAGDEFTVILGTLRDPQDAARVARRMISEIARPFMLGGQEVVVTTSIGIAVFPADGADAQILLKNADAAMYQAKSLGRNTYHYFAGEMNSAAVARLRIEGELRRARERGQLALHYQIRVDARTGNIAGLEALMRWRHPDLGMVPPGTFIPIAEEAGLIVDLGEWVIDTACRQSRAWRDAGLPPAPIAVNLASPSFRQTDLAARVAVVLKRHGVPPADLCIEATESVLMRDADATMVTLRQLRELGLKLSVDDFGTGYSSLSYLRRFPIDQLKIDRSFVNEVAVNSDDAAIVSTIVSLAKSLDLEVVAEGVETVEQARLLLRQGCHIMQGYFFGKPVPAEDVEKLLTEGIAFDERVLRLLGGPPLLEKSG